MVKKVTGKIDRFIDFVDRTPLWWLFLLLFAGVFALFVVLGESSVFDYHDQMDETLMETVLTARHLGEGLEVLPEMMGGINASGLHPAGELFVLLFRVLPGFWAFLLQYAICFLVSSLGMYLCVKELTGSSILAAAAAGCFCMLPLFPVFALSQMGIPLVLYVFLRLWKGKDLVPGLLIIALFGLTSHLVYTGYVVLAFWAVGIVASFVCKRKNGYLTAAFFLLVGVYVAINRSMFAEFLFGQNSFMSHREEMVSYPMPFWRTVWDVFFHSAQHSPSLHQYLVLPIVLSLAIGGLLFKKLDKAARNRYFLALGGMIVLAAIAVFYGICHWQPVVDLKNSLHGLLHSFQMDRFYWIYPAGWYLEMALCFSVWWGLKGTGKVTAVLCSPTLKFLILVAVLLPTLREITANSYFYINVKPHDSGSWVTRYMSWESYYSEDLMQELEDAIGRDMTTYRVAHLGMSPAPALMHGFYTVDGYSNNYPLEYKHRFRQVIAAELDKIEETRLYFDEWGSRCYLFNGSSGNAWMLGKKDRIVYDNLDFDMEALKSLDCQYLFSCGVINNAEQLGLELVGYYETEKSYWGVWLYKL